LTLLVLAGLLGPLLAAGRRPLVPVLVGELIAGAREEMTHVAELGGAVEAVDVREPARCQLCRCKPWRGAT